MSIIEGIVLIVAIICATLIALCYIVKGDEEDAMEKRSSKKMGK